METKHRSEARMGDVAEAGRAKNDKDERRETQTETHAHKYKIDRLGSGHKSYRYAATRQQRHVYTHTHTHMTYKCTYLRSAPLWTLRRYNTPTTTNKHTPTTN